jgi:hypothetical protein
MHRIVERMETLNGVNFDYVFFVDDSYTHYKDDTILYHIAAVYSVNCTVSLCRPIYMQWNYEWPRIEEFLASVAQDTSVVVCNAFIDASFFLVSEGLSTKNRYFIHQTKSD